VIYLDHIATTPIAPSVLDAMRPYLEQHLDAGFCTLRYRTGTPGLPRLEDAIVWAHSSNVGVEA
jgi:cysteine sulfinate desulfinase/cysteine desulfurase-like protein